VRQAETAGGAGHGQPVARASQRGGRGCEHSQPDEHLSRVAVGPGNVEDGGGRPRTDRERDQYRMKWMAERRAGQHVLDRPGPDYPPQQRRQRMAVLPSRHDVDGRRRR
jgi:hypothetical protein